MKVSKRCHYALRALVDLGLAQALGHPLVRIGALARKENLPERFLEQIFIQLRRAGIIESRRGSTGGYQLALPASELRFGEIIRLVDADALATACAECGENAACPYPDASICGVHNLLGEVDRAVGDVLDSVTLGDIVRRTLRKIRRNKIALPFVKMIRPPRAKREETAAASRPASKKKKANPVRVKSRRKPIRKKQSV